MKPRRFVRMFKPRFASLVESGAKLQTVRPTPKRMPAPGDIISLRCWTDKPYRSKQRVLRESIIRSVAPVHIGFLGVCLDGLAAPCNQFASNDGFKDFEEMRNWFAEQHGLPFRGIVISWT